MKLGRMTWNMWAENFMNAKRFFESKGNLQTRNRLKTKWYNKFEKDLGKVMNKLLEVKG